MGLNVVRISNFIPILFLISAFGWCAPPEELWSMAARIKFSNMVSSGTLVIVPTLLRNAVGSGNHMAV